MKPNFALTLSFDGIGLLHRAFPGWHLVGDIGFDTDDLTRDLSELRSKAQTLDPSGLRSKLVLPNDQIKYLKIPRSTDDDPLSTVKAALDGATPYAVDDLAFDWTEKSGELFIAAVAKETLAEAEAFAIEHEFSPMSFVALPDAGAFPGEPFFGVTRHSADQGISTGEIERDTAPIRVIGASKLPIAEVTDTKASAAAPDECDPSAEIPETAGSLSDTSEPGTTDPDTTKLPKAPPLETGKDMPEEIAATQSSDLPEDAGEATKPSAEPEIREAAPAAPSAFTSIRATREEVSPASPRLDGVNRDAVAPRITLGAVAEPPPRQDAPMVTGVSESALPAENIAARDIRPVPEDRISVADSLAAEPTVAAPATTPREYASSFFTRRSRDKLVSAVPAGAVPIPEDERQRMTIFGARETNSTARGKPRFLGLILTAVLLLFLIGVAAWASIFMEDGLARFFRDDDRAIALAPTGDEEAEIDPALGETGDWDRSEGVADGSVALTSLSPQQPLSILDDPATEILSRVTPQDLSPDEARARYAATGIWQLAPEPPADLVEAVMEDFYQTTLEPLPTLQDAVALPDERSAFTDGMFLTPPAPPAASTRFTLDQRGFVLATAAGALTPDAVMVFAGRPAVLPPETIRTAARQQEPGQTTGQTEPPEAEDTAAEPEAPSVAAGQRPRARPENVEEQIERNELSGRTRSELAALRPKLRPQSVQETAQAQADQAASEAEAARAQAEAEAATAAQASTVDLAALESAVAAAVATPDPFAGATAQAVQVSLKPKTPPRNFENIIARTKRNQQRQGQTEQSDTAQESEPVQVAAAQKVTPRIPSVASVSKAATERKAMKFERVNLIGVYGTPSNRRALVRMSNGRYLKVKVGDRLDGGRVNAISDTDLRYQKGGRNIVLKMPRG